MQEGNTVSRAGLTWAGGLLTSGGLCYTALFGIAGVRPALPTFIFLCPIRSIADSILCLTHRSFSSVRERLRLILL